MRAVNHKIDSLLSQSKYVFAKGSPFKSCHSTVNSINTVNKLWTFQRSVNKMEERFSQANATQFFGPSLQTELLRKPKIFANIETKLWSTLRILESCTFWCSFCGVSRDPRLTWDTRDPERDSSLCRWTAGRSWNRTLNCGPMASQRSDKDDMRVSWWTLAWTDWPTSRKGGTTLPVFTDWCPNYKLFNLWTGQFDQLYSSFPTFQNKSAYLNFNFGSNKNANSGSRLRAGSKLNKLNITQLIRIRFE